MAEIKTLCDTCTHKNECKLKANNIDYCTDYKEGKNNAKQFKKPDNKIKI